ncbi:MAG: DsbA family protein [Gammaproteobacteria bacterium]|nr:DsbA family protein [Gammaproteobacteria bacterium]
MKPVLYYVHDPMCSWCWGFRPALNQVKQALTGRIDIQYILGGLAPDTDQPMPEQMQRSIIETWKKIQLEIPGTEFNFDFWLRCSPRRSTYPACRAIIASRMQRPDLEDEMLKAIQHAYYLQAKNPSELSVLVSLAGQLGMDTQQFSDDIQSEVCQNNLLKEIEFCRNIDIKSFPSLVLKQGKSYTSLDIDYNNSKKILKQIL